MDISEEDDFRKLNGIIEDARKKVRVILKKHYQSTPHDRNRKKKELDFFYSLLQFATRKWVFDLLWEFEINSKLGFNELSRNLGEISSRLLSDRLKELKKNKLINREVLETAPPSVNYELTEKGKGFIELSMLIIWHLSGL
ncbi:MAG: putative transcriptional regulator [Promethearchaeota archaeon]|nr:MAG: putative transcriptional regulator [Candidatus Lokiarchaeota archaeon]